MRKWFVLAVSSVLLLAGCSSFDAALKALAPTEKEECEAQGGKFSRQTENGQLVEICELLQ